MLLVASGTKPPPIKAFVLAGQSNMVGHGLVVADQKRNGGRGSLEEAARTGKLGRLLDKQGKWRTRDDVWIQYFDRKGPLTVGYGAGEDCIGPEFGFGNVMGDAMREPVLLIKIAWGGKSLAVDFRPPSSGGMVGPFYSELVRQTRDALANLSVNFPEWKGRSVELTGFGWHQGWNDRINGDFVKEYEQNMANFIRDFRQDLNAPGLPFVIAETGMGGLKETNERALDLMKAQAAVARHAEFRSNVAFVGTREFWRPSEISPSSQDYHWNSNGEAYYLIGESMGRAMADLLKGRRK
ncbi:MAG: sialate O-acetylesterase [Fimbriimonadaceae bacterium]